LGHISPSGDLDAALSAAALDLPGATALLRRHRVVGLGLERLRSRPESKALPPETAEAAEYRHRLDACLDRTRAEVRAAVADVDIRAADIKGGSVLQLYSVGSNATRPTGVSTGRCRWPTRSSTLPCGSTSISAGTR
jgi:hypothetical protein